MLLLFFLCVAAGNYIVNKEALTPWDLANISNKTRGVKPVRTDANVLHYTRYFDDLPQYELGDKQQELQHDTDPLNYMKDDIQLAFDEEATALIKKLTQALQTLNKSIKNLNRFQTRQEKLYIIKIPDAYDRYVRNKRDTDKAEDVEKNSTVATTEAVLTEAKNATVDKKIGEADNSTNLVPAGVNCNHTLNTRRNFNEDLEVSNAVKARLLSYIKEYFNDIETKINSLRNVKKAFASDNEYNIGYMIANIDMLEVNLRNLKAEMEKNRVELGEKHILDMFDKVKVSNNLVTSLISALKSILERKAATTIVPQPERFYPSNPVHFK